MGVTGGDRRKAGAERSRATNRGTRRRKLRSKRARDRLVIQHAHLARTYAMRFGRGVVPFEDLVQEAWIGILIAAERYDESLGAKFSTFAKYHARRRILEIQDRDRPTNTAASPDDCPAPRIAEPVPDPDDCPAACPRAQLVRDALGDLSYNEARVIRLRDGIGYPRMTIEETATTMGLHPTSVSTIYARAKRRLREAIEARQSAA